MNDTLDRILDAYQAFLREKLADRVEQSAYARTFTALMKELDNANLERAGRRAIKQGDILPGHLAQKPFHHGFGSHGERKP